MRGKKIKQNSNSLIFSIVQNFLVKYMAKNFIENKVKKKTNRNVLSITETRTELYAVMFVQRLKLVICMFIFKVIIDIDT